MDAGKVKSQSWMLGKIVSRFYLCMLGRSSQSWMLGKIVSFLDVRLEWAELIAGLERTEHSDRE